MARKPKLHRGIKLLLRTLIFLLFNISYLNKDACSSVSLCPPWSISDHKFCSLLLSCLIVGFMVVYLIIFFFLLFDRATGEFPLFLVLGTVSPCLSCSSLSPSKTVSSRIHVVHSMTVMLKIESIQDYFGGSNSLWCCSCSCNQSFCQLSPQMLFKCLGFFSPVFWFPLKIQGRQRRNRFFFCFPSLFKLVYILMEFFFHQWSLFFSKISASCSIHIFIILLYSISLYSVALLRN